MPSSSSFARSLPLLVSIWILAAGAPAQASVRLTIQPPAIVADGHSTATVTVEVRSLRGQLVSDGTPVHFTTTGGTITPVTYTSAGVARAVLTASTAPLSVIVTAFAGTEQAIGKIQMVSELVEANVDGRVLRVNARYVAFSEELHFLDCMQDVRLRYRGLTLDANAVQIDLNQNILRAFGKIGITSGDKVLEGDRLYLNLTTFDGYLLSADNKVWFNGFGLSPLPEPPKGAAPEFEFTELTSSTLSWIGKEAV